MKMYSMIKSSVVVLAAFFMAATYTSCDVQKDEPGYSYLPDMTHSRAYETYTPNPNFADSMTMRVPVEGTVPRGKTPYPYDKNDEDMKLAGKTFENPLEPTDSIIQEGKKYYARYCLMCHGKQGRGNGHLVTSGKYNYQPRDLTSERVLNRKDGEIYHIITVGYGLMGAHGAIVEPENRWKIVHYIRHELQQKEPNRN